MADQLDRIPHFITQRDQPLIGIFRREDDHEVIQYFTEEPQADAATSSRPIQEILSLAGSWHDPNWDEVEQELNRIRHKAPSADC